MDKNLKPIDRSMSPYFRNKDIYLSETRSISPYNKAENPKPKT